MFTSPDLNTRAGRMLNAGNVAVTTKFTDGTHVTVRFKCIADNRDRSYDAKSTKNWIPCEWFDASHVFIEVPSQGDWADKIGTYYPRTGRFFEDRNADPRRVLAAHVAANHVCNAYVTTYASLPDGVESVQEEERCGVCFRTLTDPVSIQRGIGPECYAKDTNSQHQIKNVEVNPLPLKDGGTIAQQRDEHEAQIAEAQSRSASMHDLVCVALRDAATNEKWSQEQWAQVQAIVHQVTDLPEVAQRRAKASLAR